jgi:hypothetical protein
MKKTILFILAFLSSCCSNKNSLTAYDIQLFYKTPVWNLAKAVDKEDTLEISRFVVEKQYKIDYKDPLYDMSLLMWSVFNGKYNSFKQLLKLGANPNLQSNYNGDTPMTLASNYYKDYKTDSRYLKLLIKYNGQVDKITFNKANNLPVTPIYYAVTTSLEYTKILIESGVDVNFKIANYCSILESAITQEKVDVVYYLIVEKGANTNLYCTNSNGKYPLVQLLRKWIFPLNSNEYKLKMAIVDVFNRNGQNYFSTKIPVKSLRNIKRKYPNNWQKYLEQY